MHFGQTIRELLLERGISITAAAEATGKTRQTMYDLFEKPNINTDVLLRLSDKFSIPIEAFFRVLPREGSTAPPVPFPVEGKGMDQWLLTQQKIISLQEDSFRWERSRQAFGFFLQKLWDSITLKRGLRRNLPKRKRETTVYSEGYEVSTENAQKAYDEIFELYYDFGIFFETGFITSSVWKQAWEQYKERKWGEGQESTARQKLS